MTQLEPSWQRAWSALGLQPPEGLLEQLVGCYKEPHRAYHSVQHLQECVKLFEESMTLAVNPGELEMALWFHDAVYDPRGHSNERRSADWAVKELSLRGAQQDVLRRVEGLIMATCHTATPSDPDQQLLVDIDLAILGSPPVRFAQYDQQVRAEYSWVPGFIYRMKRKQVLKSFLARMPIFQTDRFRERFEQQARANLQSAIR